MASRILKITRSAFIVLMLLMVLEPFLSKLQEGLSESLVGLGARALLGIFFLIATAGLYALLYEAIRDQKVTYNQFLVGIKKYLGGFFWTTVAIGLLTSLATITAAFVWSTIAGTSMEVVYKTPQWKFAFLAIVSILGFCFLYVYPFVFVDEKSLVPIRRGFRFLIAHFSESLVLIGFLILAMGFSMGGLALLATKLGLARDSINAPAAAISTFIELMVFIMATTIILDQQKATE